MLVIFSCLLPKLEQNIKINRTFLIQAIYCVCVCVFVPLVWSEFALYSYRCYEVNLWIFPSGKFEVAGNHGMSIILISVHCSKLALQ